MFSKNTELQVPITVTPMSQNTKCPLVAYTSSDRGQRETPVGDLYTVVELY